MQGFMALAAVATLALGAEAIAGPPRGGDARAAASPRCFGAAARDAENPCVNRRLNFTAIPTPFNAPLEPSAPCEPIERVEPSACAFGPPASKAVSSVALLGDSHAMAWRAAVAVVADAKRWHGVSITRNSCPYTFASTAGDGRCKGWSGSVRRWLKAHPEVKQVVVGANSGSGVVAAGGHTLRTTKINGYIDAWKAMPQSVRDIFVVRDVPHSANSTAECVVARDQAPAQPRAALRARPHRRAADRRVRRRRRAHGLRARASHRPVGLHVRREVLLSGRRRRARHQGHRAHDAHVLALARPVPGPRDLATAGRFEPMSATPGRD